jgi:PhzF family phenazine biosynthesis protein
VEISKSSSGAISISMQQGELQLLNRHANKAVLAESLGITAADIGLQDSAGNTVLDEVRIVTTSPARHLLVPVRSKEALDRVTFANKERIAQELASTNSHNSGVYVFTAVNGRDDIPRFEARFFSPGMSMEDPATGSAAGPLAAYLWTSANPAVLASQKTNGGIAYVSGFENWQRMLDEAGH